MTEADANDSTVTAWLPATAQAEPKAEAERPGRCDVIARGMKAPKSKPNTPRIKAILEADADRDNRRLRHGLVPFDLPPPSKERWNALLDNLAHAAAVKLDSPETWNNQKEQWASILALAAVLKFLECDPVIIRHHLALPIRAVMSALDETCSGGKPDFFKPLVVPKPGKNLDRQSLETNACLAMEELMGCGISRDKAAKLVARAVAAGPLHIKPRAGATLATTIAGWRDRAKVERGGEAFKEIYGVWLADALRLLGKTTHRKRADWLMALIREPATR